MILLAGLLAAGLILLGYALIIHPQKSKKSTSLLRETKELQEATELLQKEAEKLKSTLGQAAQAGLPVYPRSSDNFREQASQIIAGVDNLVRSSGVNLLRLEPQPREQRGSLALHPFTVEVRGGFHQINAFLQAAEKELLLVPSLFAIEAGTKASEGLKASLRLIAYEWLGQRLEPKPKRETGAVMVSQYSKRDPFAPPGPGLGTERPGTQGPVLSGILMVGGKAKAIIDGKTYSQGDMVAGKRILSITHEEVVLEGDAKPLRISRPLKKVGPS